MKPVSLVAGALAVAALQAPPASILAQTRADGAVAIHVDVSGLRNANGTLNCRLFNEAGSFPDGDGIRTVRARIEDAKAACLFAELPAGTYAVAVVHDANGNGRLDRNFLGIPAEGYGVSNNRTYAMSAPKWDESRFTVAPREAAALRIELRY